MSDNDDNYIGLVLEDIRDQNKAVLEAVTDIQETVRNQPTRDEFQELVTKVDTIQLALTDTNKDLSDHERRITRLEQAA